jgi:hypothetical protein
MGFIPVRNFSQQPVSYPWVLGTKQPELVSDLSFLFNAKVYNVWKFMFGFPCVFMAVSLGRT